jgi:hypothetical protein
VVVPLLVAASASFAAVNWQPKEVVDSPVLSPAPSSGVSVLFSDDRWHIVYPKNGDLYYRARVDSGWLAPERLATGMSPWPWSGPAIAKGGGYLHVVWMGPGSRIYARRWDGVSWSTPECLSGEGYPYAWSPVIAGERDRALAVWQEYSAMSLVRVVGRIFENGAWNPIEDISETPESATDPSVSEAPSRDGFVVAWADDREGDPQIYVRVWDVWTYPIGWQTAERVTQVAGGCARPSIHGEHCCGDILTGTWFVAFEFPANSADDHEVYVVGTSGSPLLVSTGGDDILSDSPNAGGYALYWWVPFGGPYPESYITWTDGNDSPKTHWLVRYGSSMFGPSPSYEILSAAGLSTSVIGAAEGDPEARLMAAWIEERAGVPTLVAKRGAALGTLTNGVGPTEPRGGMALGVVPNPCRTEALFELRLSAATTVELRVLDAAGRLVRDLGRREYAAGVRALSWDTRDDRGRAVSPSRYYAIARAGAVEVRRPFVVLR